MSLWLVLAVNSITLGGLLFLLSSGFSLIFGLMKIPNLTHGSFFMLGAYLATSLIAYGLDFWTAAVLGGLGVAAFGGLVERFILRRLAGAELAQVLVTLGLSFMIADVCLMVWTGDPIRIATPGALRGATTLGGFGFPTYRLAVGLVAVALAAALAVLATLPLWLTSTYYVNITSQILFYAIFALAINVLAGYAGLVSLGHAGLFGIAGYAAAKILTGGHAHAAGIAGAL